MNRNEFVVIESNRKRQKKGTIVAIILLILAMGVIVLVTQFQIKKIKVSGNEHYTESEMVNELKKRDYINNSILYMIKCKLRPPEGIPFVEDMDVDYVNNHEIKVTIYEKTMAGCIENMGDYMYFDKDGIVLESSTKKFEDVPLITGLRFDSVVLNEKLPFEDKETIKQILNITQLIRKYELSIDTVKFDAEQVFLYTGKIEIILGSPDGVDEKMAELPNMLSQAKNLKGVLHLENFTVSSGIATFEPE